MHKQTLPRAKFAQITNAFLFYIYKARTREILKKLHDALKFAMVDSAKIKNELTELQSRSKHTLVSL